MNHCVPDFDMDDDYSIPTSSGLNCHKNPTSSGLNCHKKSAMQEEDIMELLWQNGQVVMQSQTQRSLKKSPPSKLNDAVLPPPSSQPQQQQATTTTTDHLFMQEDEMASWLHYPLNYSNFDSDFCADLLYSNPCVTTTTNPVRTPHAPATAALTISAPRPPIPPPPRRMELESSTVKNFAYFSRHKARVEPESGPSNSKAVVKESTVVDSSDTPAVGRESRDSEVARYTELLLGGNNGCGSISGAAVAGTSSNAGREVVEMTVTSSPGGSSASAEPSQKPPAEVRKRKGREAEDAECQSEDVEFESADAKKRSRGSTSTKRSRAAEVHNLSERRRRDRINEKMRALQELIPRCNKSDKASMLDEAIEYLKSLQLQVQMMSMGCGMVPMMFPGVQQYMAPMGMGFGMGMEMGMTRPMMTFPNALAGSVLPTPAATAHLGPRFPMPAFHMPPVPAPDSSRIQATNQSDPMLNSLGMQNPNQPRIPNFADPYQQYIGLQQMQLPLPQNQTMAQTSTSKPSSSRGAENIDNHQSGT